MPQTSEALLRGVERRSRVAVVLGSGWGGLSELVKSSVTLRAEDIPGYPIPSTSGHAGRVVAGTLAGREVVFIKGRVHLYEGFTPQHVTLPIRLAHRLGAESVIISCSAGGLGLSPGALLFLTDHMRLGPGPSLGAQGAAAPYDHAWTVRAQRAASRLGIRTVRGTICWMQGPSYETKAEIRSCMQLGAQAVGMSTIPEVLEARRLGMHVLGLALITNAAAGLGGTPLSHKEVLKCAGEMHAVMGRLLPAVLLNAPGRISDNTCQMV